MEFSPNLQSADVDLRPDEAKLASDRVARRLGSAPVRAARVAPVGPGLGADDLEPGESEDQSLQLVRPPSVSVVVPTLNEEGSIAWVLENIPTWVS